jgi:translation initiation factor 4G
MVRPDTLPDMTVVKGPPRGRQTGGNRDRGGGGGGGGDRGGNRSGGGGSGGNDGGGGDWNRGQPSKRQGGNNSGGGGNQWQRGQAPPRDTGKGKGNQNQGQRGGNRGGQNQQPLYDGPVAPLTKSENHWKPRKNSSALVVAEKKVKSILNKFTKEKFARLSAQMLEIPITTYETLNMMIDNVYDKAIDEPTFGEIYADLCVSLSQSVEVTTLVHIIESDEEPPTEDGSAPASSNAESSSHHTVYRWSNDVNTGDEQIVGPLNSPEECIAKALDENESTPVDRGETLLDIVSVSIKRGVFIKIMKKKGAEEGEEGSFYVLYFPVSEAEELGQQLSEIFLSKVECESDAHKKNSFKRSLLNKCEEEFNKQDIYEDWKEAKKAYEATKSSLEPAARTEKESDLNFRVIKIKKQMLGNTKFIGQLYKKRLLKEKIMRYCIGSLLKLKELDKDQYRGKNPEYLDSGETDLDEEDHEAVCSMFITIGSTIDSLAASRFMDICFTKIQQFSRSKSLPSRSRFMYKDLLELRENNWVPRRKEEKAQTLEEIRKGVEREERKLAQESAQNNQRGGGRDFNQRGGNQGKDFRSGGRPNPGGGGNRPRQQRPSTETDSDGFTTIGSKSNVPEVQKPAGKPQQKQRAAPADAKKSQASAPSNDKAASASSKATAAPLSKDVMERRIKSMRTDFTSDGGNVAELLLTMDEIAGTPDAGIKLVSLNADRLMECKEDERKAIYSLLSILVEKKKLSKEDVREGCNDIIEFIDSLVMDSPRAYEYLGELLGEMLRVKAIDMEWLCKQCEKVKGLEPDSVAPEKIIRLSLKTLREKGGNLAVKAAISDEKLVTALLGAPTWQSISKEVS